MAQQTLVGVYEDRSEAQQVAQELIAGGVDRQNIQIAEQSATGTATSSSSSEQGFWASLKDAFGFGDDDDRYGYREAYRRGGTIVSATAEDRQADEIAAIMQKHHPIDLDARMAEWGTAGASGQRTAASSKATAAGSTERVKEGAEAIPVVQEEIRVGKRPVSRGGVRVVSRVTERPVEEQVNLREERVNVERRPANRPVSDADAKQAFRERTIEATEMAEEAVVAKNARVVEEVVVNKDVGQRTETVRDSVRRTDVDVQKLNAVDEERFRPAYTFADEISADQRYRGRSFDEIEPDLRTSYAQRYPNSRWDDVRDAVRTRFGRGRTDA
jgi:stress response protein YsnF